MRWLLFSMLLHVGLGVWGLFSSSKLASFFTSSKGGDGHSGFIEVTGVPGKERGKRSHSNSLSLRPVEVGGGHGTMEALEYAESTQGVSEVFLSDPAFGQGENQKPDYPFEAVRKGWEGTSKLRLVFSGESLRSVILEESSGYSVLDQSALHAARSWKFSGLLGAQETWVHVPVQFQLQ